jgi:hypothetical protein
MRPSNVHTVTLHAYDGGRHWYAKHIVASTHRWSYDDVVTREHRHESVAVFQIVVPKPSDCRCVEDMP